MDIEFFFLIKKIPPKIYTIIEIFLLNNDNQIVITRERVCVCKGAIYCASKQSVNDVSRKPLSL